MYNIFLFINHTAIFSWLCIYLLQINHTDVFIYLQINHTDVFIYLQIKHTDVFIYLQINHTDVFISGKLRNVWSGQP